MGGSKNESGERGEGLYSFGVNSASIYSIDSIYSIEVNKEMNKEQKSPFFLVKTRGREPVFLKKRSICFQYKGALGYLFSAKKL